MKKYLLITTTFEEKEKAQKLIQLLLEKRLVSCCQLSNIESSYHWKGKIQHANEYLVQMKTKKDLYSKVEQEILKFHSYENPQIVAYNIEEGSSKYLKWIEEETTTVTRL